MLLSFSSEGACHVIDALNPHVGLLVFCMPLMSAHVSSRFGSRLAHLLSYYLPNKRSLHICSQDLEIPTLIGEKRKIKITHHCHYEKISLKYICA